MRKTIASVFFTSLLLIISIHASALMKQDSILKSSGKSIHPGDTLFTPNSIDDPILSYQNLVYKNRLESIQKDVSLSYNEHVQRYIDIYTGRKEQIGKMLGLSEYYFPIFERALKEAGIPEELKFLTVVESALNPQAVSRSGAVGPWQFMYATAKGYGLIMDNYTDERKDPVKASYAAARYLVDAHARIGDWLLAIAAFNCGTGAVTRAIAKSGGVADFWKVRPFLPVETQNYVPAFIATVYSMKYFKDHEISVKPAGFSTLTDVIPVNKRISISSIAAASGLDVNELLLLNPSFKREIINGSESMPMPLVLPEVKNTTYSSLYDLFNGTAEQIKPAPLLTAVKKSVPSKSEQPKKASPFLYYTVKPGDTLSEIAEKNGSSVSKIKALNGLKTSSINVGMRLKINKT
ncbi:MAG: transglycosylase SLT domain-containing protein [Daejeonella sp.]|uniref:lytic transglycosylase domain-containing protein n=1 Tax=Daejeonella sp. TaxID=2805397 RepID=UPI0027338062|nr:lytic transglycosylase domain-containing protein [Daejeonella sp.]MDP3467804.1 transglycosylase SLT domain-containing protein [Daejeonella sp.]